MMNRFLMIFLVFSIAVFSYGEDKRSALLIANGSYKNFASLANPVSEARQLSEALKKLGFSVIIVENASREKMLDAIADFEDALKKAGGIAFFHYGGHAVQVQGKNYLIPVDADIPDERRVGTRAVDVDELMGSLDASGSGTNIVILDSCRNNPLPAGSGRSATRGLTVIGSKPRNSLIIYAAESGTQAIDGLFTPALVKFITKPGLSFTEMIQQVRKEVYAKSDGAQTPGSYDQLFEPVYLAGKPTVATNSTQILAEGPAWKWIVGTQKANSWRTGMFMHSPRGIVMPVQSYEAISGYRLWNPSDRTLGKLESTLPGGGNWTGANIMRSDRYTVLLESRLAASQMELATGDLATDSLFSFKLVIFNAAGKQIWIEQMVGEKTKTGQNLELVQVGPRPVSRTSSSTNPGFIEEWAEGATKSVLRKEEELADKILLRPFAYSGVLIGNSFIMLGMPFNNFEAANPRVFQFDLDRLTIAASKAPIAIRDGASIIAFKEKVYVAGGADGKNRRPITDVNIYDPATKTWSGTNLNIPRSSPLLAVRDAKLYAIGGYDESGSKLAVIEVYDEVSKQWKRLKDMPYAVDAETWLAAGDSLVDTSVLPEKP